MASKLKEIEKEILQLPINERALLAKKLLISLEDEDDVEEDEDIERLWIEEARRRSDAYKKDKSTGIPAEEVFKELRLKYPGK